MENVRVKDLDWRLVRERPTASGTGMHSVREKPREKHLPKRLVMHWEKVMLKVKHWERRLPRQTEKPKDWHWEKVMPRDLHWVRQRVMHSARERRRAMHLLKH